MSTGNGFLLVDKPKGLTSFDVVRRARRIFACKKAGHAGTLDPQAEGLLILAFGSATRLIGFLPAEPKIYEFSIQFGTQTDSLDSAGNVVESGGPIPAGDDVASALRVFTGPLMQTPPGFSALKIGGVRAYTLARKGAAPELAPRPVTIHQLSMDRFDAEAGQAFCTVACSGGTYVRALARDIALHLGTFGFAASIRRTACGPLSLDSALMPDQLTETVPLLPARRMFGDFPGYTADDNMLQRIATGRDIRIPVVNGSTLPRQLLLYRGEDVVAVLEHADGGNYHPTTVFITPEEVYRADS